LKTSIWEPFPKYYDENKNETHFFKKVKKKNERPFSLNLSFRFFKKGRSGFEPN